MSKSKLFKYTGYSFWVGLESVVLIGLPRLLVFPVLAYLVGKEEFGFFLFAFGIVMIIGKSPSIGLSTGLLRHLKEFETEGQNSFIYTSLQLCRILMVLIILAGILVTGILYCLDKISGKILFCFLPLFLHLYFVNIIDLRITQSRVQRRFDYHAFWYCLLGVSSLVSIPLAWRWGVVGASWGYLVAHLFVNLILFWNQRNIFINSVFCQEQSRLLKSIWFNISIASVLALSSRYVYRIILGVSHSYADISVFFGATNIIDLCISPMTILGSFLLSMLSGLKMIQQFSIKSRTFVLVGIVALVFLSTAVVMIFGKYILIKLFPGFGQESAEVLKLIIIVIPCTAVTIFSGVFIMKFGKPQSVSLLNTVNLLSHVLPASILIPFYGIKGAAVSYSVGCFITACAWLVVMCRTFKGNHSPV